MDRFFPFTNVLVNIKNWLFNLFSAVKNNVFFFNDHIFSNVTIKNYLFYKFYSLKALGKHFILSIKENLKLIANNGTFFVNHGCINDDVDQMWSFLRMILKIKNKKSRHVNSFIKSNFAFKLQKKFQMSLLRISRLFKFKKKKTYYYKLLLLPNDFIYLKDLAGKNFYVFFKEF